jgi:hypothetical protein
MFQQSEERWSPFPLFRSSFLLLASPVWFWKFLGNSESVGRLASFFDPLKSRCPR